MMIQKEELEKEPEEKQLLCCVVHLGQPATLHFSTTAVKQSTAGSTQAFNFAGQASEFSGFEQDYANCICVL